MSDDRRQYRALGHDDPAIRPLLSRPGEDPVPCRIIDASVGGIGLHVSYEEPIDLELEEATWLRIESTDLPEPLVTVGMVRRKTAVEGGIAYGIAFVDWLGFLASCPSDLRTLFNQRGDYRLAFEPGDIEARVNVDQPFSAWLRDLSPYGLSFEAEAPEEDALLRGIRIGVDFELPCDGGNLSFCAVVLHAAWADGRLQCGTCFDMSATEDFAAQREILEKFLAARRRNQRTGTAG